MLRRLLLVLTILLALAAFSLPAMAHQAGPCGATEDPGHSGFAQHHIVPFAQEGMLGDGGHKPGAHRGYSLCLGVHD